MIRVLYTDDEMSCLNLVKNYLEDYGSFSVDITTSAKKGIEMASNKRYDAIISDYVMPGVDGLEFLSLVRARDEHIPFILFSGRCREEMVIAAYNAGVSFYVQKGDNLEAQFAELAHKVRQAVARRVAEERLQVRKLQATMAIDLAQIASWEYDPQTNLFTFDDVFYKLLGTAAEREGGHTMDPETYVREFVHPDDARLVIEFMESGRNGIPAGEYREARHRMVRRDGKVRNMVVRVSMLSDPVGNILKVVGVNQDVTGK